MMNVFYRAVLLVFYYVSSAVAVTSFVPHYSAGDAEHADSDRTSLKQHTSPAALVPHDASSPPSDDAAIQNVAGKQGHSDLSNKKKNRMNKAIEMPNSSSMLLQSFSTATGAPSTLPSKTNTDSPSGLPSMKPSGITCGHNDVSIRIQLRTDQYPEETTWRLKKIPTFEDDDLSSGTGHYQNKETLYDDTLCVGSEECYQFEIYDSFGDGLCCDSGEGWYKVFYNDLLVAQGGEFQSSESSSVFFGDRCPTQSPSSSVVPSMLPSLSWLPSSSNKPSTSPTAYLTLERSTSWRIFAPKLILEAWGHYTAWDVAELEFYDHASCSEEHKINVDPSRGFSSGYLGYPSFKPSSAFDGWLGSIWGGRASPKTGDFWLGMEFDTPVSVGCIKIFNGNYPDGHGHLPIPVKVQQKIDSTSDEWFDVKSTVCPLVRKWITIDLIHTNKEDWCASSSPSLSPSRSTAPSISLKPTGTPSTYSAAPSVSLSPTTAPTMLQDLIAVDNNNRRYFPQRPFIPDTSSFRYQPIPNCTSSEGEKRIGCLGTVSTIKVAPPHWAGRILYEPPICTSDGSRNRGKCKPQIPMTKKGVLSTILHAKNDGRLKRIELSGGNNGNEQQDTLAIAVADIDGDGSLDVLIGNAGLTKNQLHLNPKKNGDLEDPVYLPGGEMDTRSISAVDMNGDGFVDIIIGNYLQNNQLVLNNGDGTLQEPIDLTGGETSTQAIAIADFDGDGFNDILIGNDGGEVNQLLFSNRGALSFSGPIAIPGTNWHTSSVAVADMNGDRHIDVLFGNLDENNYILFNDGSGTFGNPIVLPGGQLSTRSIAVGDIDGDGSVDVVIGNGGQNNVVGGQINQLLLNVAGDGLFTKEDPIELPGDKLNTNAIALGDIDGDGSVDIMIGNHYESDLILLNSRGDDASSLFRDPISPVYPRGSDNMKTVAIAIADINGDRAADIVTGTKETGNLLFMSGGVSSSFNQPVPLPGGENLSSGLAIADVNGDGHFDIVVANRRSKNQLLLNRGDGSFGDPVEFPGDPVEMTTSVVAADLDGDGDIDLIWNYSLLFNRGDGHFLDGLLGQQSCCPPKDGTVVACCPERVAVADVDGDGSLDVIHAIFDHTADLLFLNRGNGTFHDPVPLPGGIRHTMRVALADMNGDGSIDIVTAAHGDIGHLLFLNAGNGTFSDENLIVLPGDRLHTRELIVADFNGDGWNDIMIGIGHGNNRIQLLLNDGNGTAFSSVIDIPVGTSPDALAPVDMDGNGSIDILVGSEEDRNQLLLNKGDGTFFDPIDLPLGDSRTSSIAAADVDNDGIIDIIVGNWGRDNLLIRYIACPSGGAQLHEASWCFDCPSYMANPTFAGVQQYSTCRECMPDHTQGEGTGQVCEECILAHRKLGEDTCVPCPDGTYYDNTFERDEHNPLTWHKDSCVKCPPGEFSNTTVVPAINECFKCRPGTYQPSQGSSRCEICKAGSFQTKFGQASCELCSKGGYCDPSDTHGGGFKPCPPGTYNEEIGKHDLSSCKVCKAGSFQTKFGQASCELCSKGGYCDASDTLGGGFKPCPPGTYNEEIGKLDLSSCIKCPSGSYSIETGASSRTSCLPCAEGTFGNETGMTKCHECKKGSFQNITNQTSCDLCEPGTYADKLGLTECISCPHRLDSAEGSVLCPFCASGFYLNNTLSDEMNVFNNPSKNCLDCPTFMNSSCPTKNTTLQTLVIPSGFWRASPNTSQLYKCDSITCAGSQEESPYYVARDSNNMYCTEGHKGPLCQVCNDKSGSYFSRFQEECIDCPSYSRLALQASLIVIILFFCLVFAKCVPSSWFTYVFTKLSTLSVQAKVKILVSFYQIVSSLDVVYGVRISRDLVAWLNIFQFLSLNIFDIIAMPKSCIGSIKQQLIVGAVWPYIVVVVGAIGISVHIIYRIRNKRRENNDEDISSVAGSLLEGAIYRLIKLLVVVLYFTIPTVSRGIFDAIKCRSFKVRDYGEQPYFKSYLLVDLEIECNVENDTEYRNIQGIFWAFFVIWPVLTPLGFLALLMYVSPSIKSKSITALADACRFLWNDYDESVWFWDVIDLWRRIFLSGFIMFIDKQEGSEKVLRLVIATIVSMLYLGALAISRPYKRRHDLHLAFVSSILLASCFSAGIILRHCNDDEDGDESGACNMFVGKTFDSFRASVVVVASVVGMLLVTSCFLLVLAINAILAPTVVLASGYNPNLEMSKDCQYHAFMSHVWETGQAKTHAITRKLQLYLPTLKIWLDVNDLEDISMLEKHIAEAEVFILYWSAKYFKSKNCRREIYAAVKLKKPVILLYEGDESVLEALREECLDFCKVDRNGSEFIEPGDILDHIFQEPPIQWLDQNVFSAAALNRIYSRLLRHLPYYQRKPGELDKGVLVPGELQPLPLKEETNVLVCGENHGSRALAMEIKLSLPEKEVELMKIIDAEEYFQQSNGDSERDKGRPETQPLPKSTVLLLYLNESFFQGTEGLLKDIIQSSIEDPNIKIILVHEQDTKKGGCDFGLFFDLTPEDLINPPYDIFKTNMAIPLYSIEEYRTVSIRDIVRKFGIKKETDSIQTFPRNQSSREEDTLEGSTPDAELVDNDKALHSMTPLLTANAR